MGLLTHGHEAPRDPQAWWICILLLCALMLNYMDRQTLSLTIVPISKELQLSNQQYGQLEKGFGYAFAVGGLLFGFLADRTSVRWMYPVVLLGWSAAGMATAFGDRIGETLVPAVRFVWPALANSERDVQPAFLGLLACRTMLGLFEAGQWPCALITTQRLLAAADRPFGNSLLQSGASLGAITTPVIVQLLVTDQPGSWRSPYLVVGALGLAWLAPWWWYTARLDLSPRPRDQRAVGAAPPSAPWRRLASRYLALSCVVIVINLTWHFFRAWLPKMLEEYHGYSAGAVRLFIVAYYVTTDVGCLASGSLTRYLAARGQSPHRARLTAYLGCACLTSLSMFAATQQRGPFLLALLLLIGFGSLGLFPIFLSLTQELSVRHQGIITGSLTFVAWVATSEMQTRVGKHVDQTGSYADGIFWLGLAPAVGFAALGLLWGRDADPDQPQR